MDYPDSATRPGAEANSASLASTTAMTVPPSSALSTPGIEVRPRPSTLVDAVLDELDRFGDRIASYVGLR